MNIFAPICKLSRLQLVLIIICVLLLLGGVGFLGRGVWRSNILPPYALMRHGAKLQAVHNAERIKINKILKQFELTVGQKVPATCHLDLADTWRTAIYCGVEDQNVSRALSPFHNVSDRSVKQVQTSLERDGWRGGVSAPEGRVLHYIKIVQGFDCTFQLWVGSDQDTAPRLFCYQTYFYLGKPY